MSVLDIGHRLLILTPLTRKVNYPNFLHLGKNSLPLTLTLSPNGGEKCLVSVLDIRHKLLILAALAEKTGQVRRKCASGCTSGEFKVDSMFTPEEQLARANWMVSVLS